MKRVHQLVACFLALSVFLAGLVAVSPALHVVIEHGGQGPAHTHRGGPAVASSALTLPDPGHVHPHEHAPVNRSERPVLHAARLNFFVSNHGAFTFREVPLRRVWEALSSLLERAGDLSHPSPDPASDGGSPGHEHRSLAQLLACGLIEQTVEAPWFELGFVPCPFVSPAAQEVLLLRPLDAQTAGRAPPSAWS